MIVFKKVKIQNFLSYGNSEVDINLDRENPTLISGINYDASSNGELDSNGSGKSSILEAVAVALYDKPVGIDNPKKNALVNNINNKDMLITLELTTKKKNYTIYRYRKNKAMGGDGVKIEENKKDITPDSVANANKFIAEHIMEIPYEIFGKIVAYAAGTDSFLKMNLATQRGIIEELFSYTELSRKADTLKEKIKNNKRDLEYAKESNEDIREEYERHVSQVKDAKRDHVEWKRNHETQISNCKEKLEAVKSIDFETELECLKSFEKISEDIRNISQKHKDKTREIETLGSDTKKYERAEQERATHLESTQENLSKMTIPDESIDTDRKLFEKIEESNEQYALIEKEEKSINRELDNLRSKLAKLESEKTQLEDSKCPYCSQNYAEAKKKLVKVNENISEISGEISENEASLGSLQDKKAKIEKTIKKSTEKLNFKNLHSLEEYVKEKAGEEHNLKYYQEFKNPYEDHSEKIKKLDKIASDLKKEKLSMETEMESTSEKCLFKSMEEYYSAKNKVDGLTEKLEYLEEQTNPYNKILESLEEYEPKENKDDEIDNLIDEIKHQEFLLKLLTKKDSFIRKALMDKYLPFLNERLKNYLSMMGLPHKVRFTSDLSTEISQFNKDIAYSNLSSGQRARIDIALSLAFRDVLQSKHNFINLFILDECLDVGLSNVGVKKTLKVIKDVAKNNKLSMFVISHRDEIRNAFKDTIEIELRNGFSNIT